MTLSIPPTHTQINLIIKAISAARVKKARLDKDFQNLVVLVAKTRHYWTDEQEAQYRNGIKVDLRKKNTLVL